MTDYQNISGQEVLDRVADVVAAIANRRWIHGTYEAETVPGEPDAPISRNVLPFRVYVSKAGNYVMDGFDTYRKYVRTFRVDRWDSMELADEFNGEADPNVFQTRGGQVAVYPASPALLRAKPQTVSAKALDKFLAAGWSLDPYADVITQ